MIFASFRKNKSKTGAERKKMLGLTANSLKKKANRMLEQVFHRNIKRVYTLYIEASKGNGRQNEKTNPLCHGCRPWRPGTDYREGA